MGQDDVIQIKVDGHGVGIIGLKTVMEDMAEEYAGRSDEEVETELLSRLRRKNYIPDSVTESYKRTFVREFRKFLGQPFEDDSSAGLEIKILGPGCAQCDRLEQELMEVMAETNVVADVEHIRDIKEIAKYGIMGTPALIMNGDVKSVGKVPPKAKLMEWLHQAKEKK